MRVALLLFISGLTRAETPHLTVEGGLAPGTASELRPLAWSPALEVFLIERNDKRPNGSERSWNFYGKGLDLLGYATLESDGAVATDHVQWMGEGSAAQKGALAELATKAREKLVIEPKSLDKLWADWTKLKAVACPVRPVKREGAVDLMAKDLLVATIDTPLAPADQKRGCGAPIAGALRCLSGGEAMVIVVPFKQDCGVSQTQLLRYDPRALEYLKEAQLGEAALQKNDLPGAKRHLEMALRLDDKYAPSHYFHACAAARSGVDFRAGRGELEQILGSEDDRQKWLPKIKSDPNLKSWQSDPEFNRWLSQFPTRTPIH
jgi:hypothetical protein